MAMHLDHFSISSPNLYYGVHQCVWRGPFRAASAGLPPSRLWRFGEPRHSSHNFPASGGGKAPRHRIRKPH